MQRNVADTTQRIDRTVVTSASGDKTEILEPGEATLPAGEPDLRARAGKPQNIIVDSNTRLAFSQIFDSTAALKRLTEPDRKDHARLVTSPRPPNFLVRMWRDLEMRILVGALVAAAIVAFYLAAL